MYFNNGTFTYESQTDCRTIDWLQNNCRFLHCKILYRQADNQSFCASSTIIRDNKEAIDKH